MRLDLEKSGKVMKSEKCAEVGSVQWFE